MCPLGHLRRLINCRGIIVIVVKSMFSVGCMQSFQHHIVEQRQYMQSLDVTGTYLKYFGNKKDMIHVKNKLFKIQLQWKRLVQRAGVRERQLQKDYCEDKRVLENTFISESR